jgi:hypothetical protein
MVKHLADVAVRPFCKAATSRSHLRQGLNGQRLGMTGRQKEWSSGVTKLALEIHFTHIGCAVIPATA